jgi:cytochrome c oxidase subunit I+III
MNETLIKEIIGEHQEEREWSERRRLFERVWTAPTDWTDWFKTVNNQPFGNRFMMTSFVLFCLAGLQALLMRTQLAFPDNDVLGPAVYNQLFTMHGSTMMYLVILPFLEGLAVYILPLVVGAREMAFPRMSAFSFWVFFFGALVFYSGFLFNAVPDTGWFVYPPISLSKFSGLGLDFLLVGLGFIEIAGVGTGIEIVTTALKFRAPGMSLGRMPLFAWAWLVTGVMIVFAFSTLFGATVLIELDRAVGTCFFNADCGGNALLWQHLFWFFGHPDVYVMFIPATGIISMILPTFARRPIAGYKFIAVAILATAFMSFGLWVHHMFTTGLPLLAMGFFAAASLMIAIASGTQVFAWIATIWRTQPQYKTPFLYALGFLFIFVIGGITGVMVAIVPFDWQVHDTYFVVAHFHYVLIGGVVFPILAGFHYWLPLIIGRLPSERLGRWSFWIIFIAFNLTFFPMHMMGFKGMARRVYTYPAELGIGNLNLLSTVGAFLLAAGFALVGLNVLRSLRKKAKAERNPWGGSSLEWMVTVDMANYMFLRPPVIRSRDPLWEPVTESNTPSDPKSNIEAADDLEALSRALEAEPAEWRASLITDAVTGEPQSIQRVAGPSYIPITAAIGMLVSSIATLIQMYLVALAGVLFTLVVTAHWLWPRQKEIDLMRASDLPRKTGLPVEPTGSAASGWWAMIGALTVIGTVFGVYLYSYFYLRLYSPKWPQGEIPLPNLLLPGLMYLLLPLSCGAVLWAKRGYAKGEAWQPSLSFLGAALTGLGFVGLLLQEVTQFGFSPKTNAYASLFHCISWHMAFLALGGVAFLFAAAIRVRQDPLGRAGYTMLQVQVTEMYWYFTAVMVALVYGTLYLSPHMF